MSLYRFFISDTKFVFATELENPGMFDNSSFEIRRCAAQVFGKLLFVCQELDGAVFRSLKY